MHMHVLSSACTLSRHMHFSRACRVVAIDLHVPDFDASMYICFKYVRSRIADRHHDHIRRNRKPANADRGGRTQQGRRRISTACPSL